MRTALLLIAFLFLFHYSSHSQDALKTTSIIGHMLSTPVGVTVDETGKIYVANSYQVRVLNADGSFYKDILTANIPFWGRARAVATDAAGNLYVWDAYTFYLYKYDREGNLLHKFQNHLAGSFTSSYVEGIAVALDGSIYITDVTKHVVRKFSNNGEFLLEINSLNTPTDVAVGPDGSVYVADTGNKRIAKFNAAGQLLTAYSTPGSGAPAFGRPTGVEVSSNGIVHVADASNATVYTFNQDGEYRLNLNLPGVRSDENLGIGLDKDGNMYVTASGRLTGSPQHGKVFKLLPTGEREAIFGEPGPTQTGLRTAAMETDSLGHYLYIGNNASRKIEKYNRQGIKLTDIGNGSPQAEFGIIQDIVTASDGALYVLDSATVKRFSAYGSFVTNFEPIPANVAGKRPRLTAGLDHFLYVLVDGKVAKYNRAGKLLSVTTLAGVNTSYPNPIYQDIAVDATGNLYIIILLHSQGSPLDAVYEVNKYDPDGLLLLQYKTRGRYILEINIPKSIEVDKAGNVYVAGNSVEVFDTEGQLKGYLPVSANLISVNAAGSTVLAGALNDSQVLILKNNPDPAESFIAGTIFHDANSNNVQDAEEAGIKGIPVRVEPGSVFGFSDASGKYSVPVEHAGTYKVTQVLPTLDARSSITQLSPEGDLPHTATITAKGSTVAGMDFANRVTLSPHLSVSVSSTRRRRCFESTTTVRYVNSGFATAPDARVYVQLPAEVELLSADNPYTRQPDGTYVFAVGDLTAGQQGKVTIQDMVTCGDESVRGRTVCTRAWVTPSNNATTKPTPTVTIAGRCDAETGRIRFVLKNSGTADMEQHELLRKYRDGRLASSEQFKLAAGDSMVFWVPSMGSTWRLEADQPEGNGDNTTASVTLEACTAANASTTVTSGLVNLLPTDDEEAEVSEECVPITDSYDPNDKLVTPVGRTAENYTPTNTALKYKIRFQNTGTDVAYRVVVVDTLSEHLDLSTLQMGAASHAHRLEVSGKGRPVLTWTFDNIMLPDSNANEPGSHGYIQFSIKPKAGLPEKTAVENLADIFFDYNSPVRTNTTLNRIYDMPSVVDEEVRVHLEEVLATPAIAAFAPAAGKYGTQVLISGKRFAPEATANRVYLNGKAATVVGATDSELRVLVPEGASTGPLKVVTPDGGVSATEVFEVYQPPVLSSFSPSEGLVGNVVNLQGQHLQLIEAVKLGNLNCEIVYQNSNQVSVKVPAGAVTGTFTILTKGGEVESASPYSVWYRPTISSLSQGSGIVGDVFTITGENFTADKARLNVLFGLVQAPVLEAGPQRLVVRVPEQAESNVLVVETPGGAAFARFEVIPGPRFTAMQPAQGSVGTVVEVSGQHFGVMGLQDKITFNGREAIVLETSGDKYKVRVPRGATTGKVEITGYGGKAYSTADFVVEGLPMAEAIVISPNPSDGRFYLDLHRADFEVQLLQVFSSLGQMVLEQRIAAPRPEALQVQLPQTQAGIYLLRLHTDRGLLTYKLYVR
ncbi:DUF7619 domain-containing protein [Pontibacter litorisediminis]|uniref:DUF7619 domain-containing protein n=1 Tax=Pontibacter litorisediminis TaxID=1846260 RepID=UPI0023EC35EA|nr:IPT/TIG domain-containing protein [Pontibacter litorisediminis]